MTESEATLPFDVYVRVSKVDGREGEQYGSPEVQEAACRAWAERHDVEVDDVVIDEDASGALDADDRLLGGLIRRVEEGWSGGVLVRHLDRFGRGMIAGSVAMKRLADAGGRLVAVEDGFDSSSQGSKINFQMRMMIAEDYLDRVSANFVAAQERAAKRKVYLSARPPLGYLRLDQAEPGRDNSDGRGGCLVRDARVAPVVAEAFRRRGEGESVAKVARWICDELGEQRITTSGMYKVLANRAYLGESTVQNGRKGHPKVLTGQHEPLVTPAMFDAVQAQNGRYEVRTGVISGATHLLGIAMCASCGQSLRGTGGGKSKNRRAYYTCTGPKQCPHRASVSADKLNERVWALLTEAVAADHPGVTAIIDGDDAYQDALAAVEQAREDLEAYRDSPDILRELGPKRFAEGLKNYKEALRLAQRQLREHRPRRDRDPLPGEMFGVALAEDGHVVTTVERSHMRDALRMLVRRVDVRPSTRNGPRPNVEERTRVWLAGDEVPADGFGTVVVTGTGTRASN